MSFACKDVAELLPFFLNGSLGVEEEGLRCHLAACNRCRQELVEVQKAWLVFDSHIPSMILVEYAQGMEMESGDRRWIDNHLALCSSCAELASLVTTHGISEDLNSGFAEAKGPRERRWSLIAGRIAAAIVVLATFVWLGSPDAGEDSRTRTESVSGSPIVVSESPLGAENPFLDGFETGTTSAWSLVQETAEEPSALDL